MEILHDGNDINIGAACAIKIGKIIDFEKDSINIQDYYDGQETYKIKQIEIENGCTKIAIMIFVDGFHLFRTGHSISNFFSSPTTS